MECSYVVIKEQLSNIPKNELIVIDSYILISKDTPLSITDSIVFHEGDLLHIWKVTDKTFPIHLSVPFCTKKVTSVEFNQALILLNGGFYGQTIQPNFETEVEKDQYEALVYLLKNKVIDFKVNHIIDYTNFKDCSLKDEDIKVYLQGQIVL